MEKTILLTGGAGYIGSHTAYLLHTLGFRVIMLDTFFHAQNFDHSWAKVIKGDAADRGLLTSIFATHDIYAVMHFAGFIEVGESVKRPDTFYHNNIVSSLTLLDVMREHQVKKIIFSSTCAVYGNPVYTPMDEQHPLSPLSPYAKTKLAIEYALKDYSQAYGIEYVVLRYFNAAGAMPEYGLGECHDPETHVIPILLRAIKDNKPFIMFGTDYDTHDGTCIRDYVHVRDIAQAHIRALEYLDNGGACDVFNLGSGIGYSVKQIIDVAQKVCCRQAMTVANKRRPGDASVLVADTKKTESLLGWKAQYSNLDCIIQSAWEWELRNTLNTSPCTHSVA